MTKSLAFELRVLLAGLLVGCGGADGTGSTGDDRGGAWNVFITPTSLSVVRGQTGTAVVSVQGKPRGAVSLAVGPFTDTSIKATLTPSSISGASTSTLTISVGVNASIGSFPLFVRGGDSGGDSSAVSLSLTVAPGPVLSVTRNGSGTGTVTSNPAGIGCGSACAHQFAAGTNVTLTETPGAASVFAGWSGGCTGTNPSCTVTIPSGPTMITATFNSTLPSVSLAVAPPTVSVAQGGSATAAVTVARSNFTGAVNLAVSGAPNGLTVTPTPASVTGDASTLNIAAPSSLAVGNYPVTVTATAPGVAQQAATFKVQVTPAPGGSGNVALSFAGCDPTQVPIWLAVQNGTGPWTRVTAGPNSTFTFPMSATDGIAYVQHTGTTFSTSVLYVSGAELTSLALGDLCRNPQTGTKRVTGTIVGLGPSPVFATVSIGGADTVSPGGSGFTLANVPVGTRDLLAAAHAPNPSNGLTPVQGIIFRRNVNYADGATIPELNFGSSERFIPAPHFATVNNLGTDQASVSESFITMNGGSSSFHDEPARNMARYFAIPDSLLQPSDFHVVQVDAVPAGNNPTSARVAFMILHSATDQTVTLGPSLATPTVTSVGTTPYLRLRAQVASQAEYNGAASVDFEQNGNVLSVAGSAAYFGGTPANWTLTVPDLTDAGYDAAWGLRSGAPVNWTVSALSTNVFVLVGAPLVDGTQLIGAARSNSSASLSRLRRSRMLSPRWKR